MEPLRPNDRRAKNAISMVWAVLALRIVATLFTVIEEGYISKTSYVDYHILIAFYYGMSASGILFFILFIASAITFIMWFRRAYFNLHQIGNDLLYGEGWAAGSWFIPVLNLYMPYQIMKDLYTKTNSVLSQNLMTCNKRLPIKYINWWWGLWIITLVLENISFRSFILDDIYGIASGIDIIVTLLYIPLSFITVKIIKDYSEIEEVLAEVAVSDTYNISEESQPIPEAQNS